MAKEKERLLGVPSPSPPPTPAPSSFTYLQQQEQARLQEEQVREAPGTLVLVYMRWTVATHTLCTHVLSLA